jgi:hypothetical protein
MLQQQLPANMPPARANFGMPPEAYTSDESLQAFFLGQETEFERTVDSVVDMRRLLKRSIDFDKMRKHHVALIWSATDHDDSDVINLRLTKWFRTDTDEAVRKAQANINKVNMLLSLFPDLPCAVDAKAADAFTATTLTQEGTATEDRQQGAKTDDCKGANTLVGTRADKRAPSTDAGSITEKKPKRS